MRIGYVNLEGITTDVDGTVHSAGLDLKTTPTVIFPGPQEENAITWTDPNGDVDGEIFTFNDPGSGNTVMLLEALGLGIANSIAVRAAPGSARVLIDDLDRSSFLQLEPVQDLRAALGTTGLRAIAAGATNLNSPVTPFTTTMGAAVIHAAPSGNVDVTILPQANAGFVTFRVTSPIAQNITINYLAFGN